MALQSSVTFCDFAWYIGFLKRGERNLKSLKKKVKTNYSSSHIVQIMDFLEFLHEYWKEKS